MSDHVVEEESMSVQAQDAVGGVVLRQTTMRSSLRRSLSDDMTQRQVDALAQQSAQSQALTTEQFRVVQARQEELARLMAEHLERQQATQAALEQQQLEMKNQMLEQQRYLAEQCELLRIADAAMVKHRQEIDTLTEAVKAPGSDTRWGWFARRDEEELPDADKEEKKDAPIVVATGANMPTPPIYRGSSKKEKREFMDSYLVYERRVRALDQGCAGKVYLMPLGACIENKTLLRICQFELFKSDDQVSEDDWRQYFLAARTPDFTDYSRRDSAVKHLAMDTRLTDAESRMSRLMADFHAMLDANNMESLITEDPKRVIGCLMDAVRPFPLRARMRVELAKPENKTRRESLQEFLRWARGWVDGYLPYETLEQRPSGRDNTATVGRAASSNGGGGKQSNKQPRSGEKPGLGGAAPGGVAVKGGGAPKDSGRRCFKCQDPTHGVFQCPHASEQEAKELYERFSQRKKKGAKPQVNVVAASGSPTEPSVECLVNGWLRATVTPDSGADVTVLLPSLVTALVDMGSDGAVVTLDPPVEILGVGATSIIVESQVKMDLHLDTPSGRLVLRNIVCWVSPHPFPGGKGEILLSRMVMSRLGYDPARLIEEARRLQPRYDMDLCAPIDLNDGYFQLPADHSPEPLAVRLCTEVEEASMYSRTVEETQLDEAESSACFPDLSPEDDREAAAQAVWEVLQKKVTEAEAHGCSVAAIERLTQILVARCDVFRVRIGRDPAVDVPPMEVRLKPEAHPVRCKARRYTPAEQEFMRQHVRELVEAGLVYRNSRSRWCSPPLIVQKVEPGQYRMTVDVRAVNSQTDPVVWPMPILEVVFEYLVGSSRFFLLDLFKGYWQFALAPECQELFSFLTDEGVFTPTRVLMGASDSVAIPSRRSRLCSPTPYTKDCSFGLTICLGMRGPTKA